MKAAPSIFRNGLFLLTAILLLPAESSHAALSGEIKDISSPQLTLRERLQQKAVNQRSIESPNFVFDIPVSYNPRVSRWIRYFSNQGATWFRNRLERSTRYMPMIEYELRKNSMPLDLAYVVMIESGFSANAVSHASAVGPWQFIATTAKRYDLEINWWLDERRDFHKSTRAAIRYMQDLYKEFGSWYLVAAGYNMGENGLRRRIRRHKTNDYWELVRLGALPKETQDYVPKILAALMISKAPGMYGFRDLGTKDPLAYDLIHVPGGTKLDDLADHLGVTRKSLRDLNAELIQAHVPKEVRGHLIRVPKGASSKIIAFIDRASTRLAMD